MPLLNYTTKVDADKTIGEIQRMLAKAGARKIMTEYGEGGLVESLAFSLDVSGNAISYRLPTDFRPVMDVLAKQKIEPRYKTPEQANNVAWRITKDWVKAQLAIIETRMAKPEQVFLPYMVYKSGKTLYEHMESNQFLLTE